MVRNISLYITVFHNRYWLQYRPEAISIHSHKPHWIKQLQLQLALAFPQNRSVQIQLLQLWTECLEKEVNSCFNRYLATLAWLKVSVSFSEKSPPLIVVEGCRKTLLEAGFVELSEKADWSGNKLQKTGKVKIDAFDI